MKDSLHQLRMLIGHVIAALIVELYLYEDEDSPNINDVELTFNNGVSFVFGCSGEGDISIRKDKARVNPNLEGVRRAELIPYDYGVGSKLDGIDKIGNSLTLNINGKRLVFVNEDDELVVRLDDHEVAFCF